jgi:hypothetical protein
MRQVPWEWIALALAILININTIFDVSSLETAAQVRTQFCSPDSASRIHVQAGANGARASLHEKAIHIVFGLELTRL